MPEGEKYIVKNDGHPNELAHREISNCISQKLTVF